MAKVFSITNGCEEGQLKSMQVQEFFRQNGFSITNELADADFIIFFSCGLTAPKETQSTSIIRKIQTQKKSEAKFIVWGCLSKINPQELRKIYSGPIVGPKDLSFFNHLLGEKAISINDVSANAIVLPSDLELQTISNRVSLNSLINSALWRLKKNIDCFGFVKRKWLFDESSFFIRIAEGCTGKCTYCSEKVAWGRVESRPVEKILTEFKMGLAKGYKRFFLVAADLGSYGIDIDSNLVDLLEQIVSVGGFEEYNLILNQINPGDLQRFLPELEKIFATGRIEAVGCQVESGSDRILEFMGRNYTADSWRDVMLRINEKFPSIRLSTHVMIGFPTESEEDFEATLRLFSFPLFIDWVGTFVFSPRPTVYASHLHGQIPYQTKQIRHEKLIRIYLRMYIINAVINNLKYLKSKIESDMF